MATPEQRDAYRRVVNLIYEEIEGCELDRTAKTTIELLNVVLELEQRIIEGPQMQSTFAFNKTAASSKDKFRDKYVPKKKWQRGPLAVTTASAPIAKPPWYDG